MIYMFDFDKLISYILDEDIECYLNIIITSINYQNRVETIKKD